MFCAGGWRGSFCVTAFSVRMKGADELSLAEGIVFDWFLLFSDV